MSFFTDAANYDAYRDQLQGKMSTQMSQAFELKPMNKYVWLDPITAENKVGSLYVVSHSQNSYQLGKIRAVAECDETKGLVPGTTVLYDALGAVNHRVGNQTITTIKAVNILGIVTEADRIQQSFDFARTD